MAEAIFQGDLPWIAVAWGAWCLGSGLLACVLTYAVLRITASIGVVDRPNARSSHVLPTPRGGGLAIVAVSLAAVLLLVVIGVSPPSRYEWVVVGGLVVAGVSFLDDVSSVSHRLRLLIHFLAAVMAVAAMSPAHVFDFGTFGSVDIGIAGWGLSVVWIVGMTNAFNFMDGIDGIAGITAAVSLAFLSAGFFIGHWLFASLYAAALASAAVGFLAWNWQPARIFMGDVGSAFLGYTIAAMPLFASDDVRRWLFPWTVMAMWPFLFDTAYTLVRRATRGENVFEAHRSHLYQRLVIAGWSHRAVALLYGALSAVTGGALLVGRCVPASSQVSEVVAVSSVVLGAAAVFVLVHGAERKIACRSAS